MSNSNKDDQKRKISKEDLEELNQVYERESQLQQRFQRIQQQLNQATGAKNHVANRIKNDYDISEDEIINEEGYIVENSNSESTE